MNTNAPESALFHPAEFEALFATVHTELTDSPAGLIYLGIIQPASVRNGTARHSARGR